MPLSQTSWKRGENLGKDLVFQESHWHVIQGVGMSRVKHKKRILNPWYIKYFANSNQVDSNFPWILSVHLLPIVYFY